MAKAELLNDEERKECVMYVYNAEILRVVDGDTVDVLLDLGFYVKIEIRLRLADIDAPEPGGKEKAAGKKSKQALYGKLFTEATGLPATTLKVRTYKDPAKSRDKYGRWVAYIWTADVQSYAEVEKRRVDGGRSINAWMVREGHAVWSEGGDTA